MPHGGDQDDDGAEVYLPTEESRRRWCHPLPATVAVTAETQPVAVRFGQIIRTSPRISRVVGAVQTTAARTRVLVRGLGKILIDRKKKQPETSIAKQIMIHRRVLRGRGEKPYGVHPSETEIQRSGSPRGIFLAASAKLLKICGLSLRDLTHGQRLPTEKRSCVESYGNHTTLTTRRSTQW